MSTFRDVFVHAFAREFELDDGARSIDAWESRWAAAVEAWPGLEPDPRRFVGRLRMIVGHSDEGMAGLGALHWNDLLLATECLTGSSRAVLHLERRFGSAVEQAVGRIHAIVDPPAQFRRDLWAELLEPRPERSPRLAAYAGRGSLGAWLRVVAVRRAWERAASDRQGAVANVELANELGVESDDPELSYLKALYREEFKRAFAEAAQQLGLRERNLLRHSIIDGLNIDQIGRIYHVHRATAARQLERARLTLRTRTRALLMQRLDIQPSVLRSLSRLVESQLDLSVRRVLARPAITDT